MKTNHSFHSTQTHRATALLAAATAVALALSTFNAFALAGDTPVCITFWATHSSGAATGIRGDQPDASGASTYCSGGKIDAHIGGGTPRLVLFSNTTSNCGGGCRRLNFNTLVGLICGGYKFPAPGSGQISDLATDIAFTVDVSGDGIIDLDGDGDPSHNDLRNLPPNSGPFPIAVRFRHYDTTSLKTFWSLHYGDIFGLQPLPKTAQVTTGPDTDGDGKPNSWLIESKGGATAELARTQNWKEVARCQLSETQTPVFSMLIVK